MLQEGKYYYDLCDKMYFKVLSINSTNVRVYLFRRNLYAEWGFEKGYADSWVYKCRELSSLEMELL